MNLAFLRSSFYVFCLLAAALFSCNNRDAGDNMETNPDAVYFDYHFSAAEEGGDIALKMQYRSGGLQGTAMQVEPPGGVAVDGEAVEVDSSGIDGAFYEVIKPFDEFTGSHQVVFTAKDGRKYEETVEFPAFRLKGSLPDTIGREGLTLDIAGLNPHDVIHIMLTDTAAFSRGFERIDSLKNGQIMLSASELGGLKSGPANFQLIRHRTVPLKQTTREGGRLSVSYSVSREVFIR